MMTQLLCTIYNNNNNSNTIYSTSIYGKAIARVHLGYLNECGPAPGVRQIIC